MSDEKTPAFDPDLLAQMMSANPPKDALEMRAQIDGMSELMNDGLPEIGALHEGVVIREVDGHTVTADVAVPTGPGPHPVLVYLHGGGWVCGSPRTHRKLGMRFAEAGYLVFNVDYRLAPEHPFPAPYDDCVASVRWAAGTAERYGGDATRLAVGGDSAGGNLTAAVAAALADDAAGPEIRALLLIYGVFDFAKLGGDPSDPMYEFGQQMMEIMVGSYLGSGAQREALLADTRVSPIHLAHKLPPSHVVVGSLDPLIEQAETISKLFARAGIAHEHVVVDGMPHGFAQMEFLPPTRETIDRMVRFLDTHVRG